MEKDINKKIKSDFDNALNNIGNDSELNKKIKNISNEKYEIKNLKDINDKLNLSDINNTTFFNPNTSMSLNMTTVSGPIRRRKKFRFNTH